MKLKDMSSKDVARLEARVVKMLADGQKYKAIMVATGLNHSQVDRISYRNDATFAAQVEAFNSLGDTDQARVVAARQGGASWGMIGLYLGGDFVTGQEGKARSLWTAGTELKSQGLRIGKGGRFYYRDGVLYEETLKPTGTEIPKGADHADARKAAFGQKLIKMEMPEVKAVAEAYSVTVKGKTKAQIVRAIVKAAYITTAEDEQALVEAAQA